MFVLNYCVNCRDNNPILFEPVALWVEQVVDSKVIPKNKYITFNQIREYTPNTLFVTGNSNYYIVII